MDFIYIYCLVDPRNHKPFYVGATSDLKSRMAAHRKSTPGNRINENCITNRRAKKIVSILNSGHEIQVVVLKICVPRRAAKWEVYYYSLFADRGEKLIQLPVFHPNSFSLKYFNTHNLNNF